MDTYLVVWKPEVRRLFGTILAFENCSNQQVLTLFAFVQHCMAVQRIQA